jgi:hypothetical protein
MFDAKNTITSGEQGLTNRRMPARTPFLAVLIALLFLPLSCSRTYTRGLRLPTDPAVTSELGWALVTTAYTRLKASPDAASADAGALRGGDIFACRQRRIDPRGSEAGGFWYQYAEGSLSGWVSGGDVEIFASAELAKASRPAAKP